LQSAVVMANRGGILSYAVGLGLCKSLYQQYLSDSGE
jgi:hypothetical protein